ncbi:recombination protein RecR [Firmicutes bacterium CAG:308]|nr:recombination protein RecR [Firmicutes bacterium CAG:308]
MYPKKFEDLIQAYSKLPGVGRKTAERYAFTTLNWDEEWINEFITSLSSIKDGIKRCKVCGNLSDGDKCEFCMNDTRNHNVICVVQSPKDIAAIESMQEYNGVYHVLNGLINIQKGILPENLNIQSLVKRINDDIEEVIIATDPTVEGETTALYITKLLDGRTKVTRLAHGIPMGGHLDYTDAHTLLKAFEGRK